MKPIMLSLAAVAGLMLIGDAAQAQVVVGGAVRGVGVGVSVGAPVYPAPVVYPQAYYAPAVVAPAPAVAVGVVGGPIVRPYPYYPHGYYYGGYYRAPYGHYWHR